MSDPAHAPAGAGATAVLLPAFLAILAAQRAWELIVSSRNTRRLLARGAREHGRGHLAPLILLHALFPCALLVEVLALRSHPGALAPLWAALWLAAQWLRWASMRALGGRWSIRVLVLPGEPLVRHGVYRWLRHPSYVAVGIELLAGPLLFGAWRTALAFSAVNAIALRVRIRCEERALAGAAA